MAARWKAYAPNTILKAVEVQDLADNGVIQLDTAADLASADLVNANVVYVVDEAKPYVRQAAGVGADKWQVFSGGLSGLGGWADITATTGSPTKHEYTDADGVDWTAYEWTGDGTATTTEGLVDGLLVAGGSGAGVTWVPKPHGGGRVLPGVIQLTAGTHTVTVGAGAPNAATADGRAGGSSEIGPHRTGAHCSDLGMGFEAGTSGSDRWGLHSSITGVDVSYGEGYNDYQPRPNKGDGGRAVTYSTVGSDGCVIIRVPRANAKA